MTRLYYYSITFLFISYLSLISPSTLLADENGEAFTESIVIFNTVCAKCHEGECSGRLSFHMPYEESANHIVRHHSEASGNVLMQKQLYLNLSYMKEKCAYYPMQVNVPKQLVWNREILDRLKTKQEKNYFIPVGNLVPDDYKLVVTLKADTKVTVHIVSEEFDMVIEDCYLSKDRKAVFPFKIESDGQYYVRLYLQEPISISQLIITNKK